MGGSLLVSTFAATCDALIEDLRDNVPSLAVDPENVHRYLAWFPEQLVADGDRHLAVFPSPDNFDAPETEGAPIGAHLRSQGFVILVWEPAEGESQRATSDEEGAKALLNLYEAVLARLYVTANQTMAGSWKQWFAGASVPARSGQVRWFSLVVARSDILNFT